MSNSNFRWTNDGTQPSLTPKFILSREEAPRLKEVLPPDSVPIPIIDMGAENEAVLAEMVAKASEEFGVFRIINHRLSEDLWLNTAESVRDFFLLPPEIKSRFAGEAGTLNTVRVLRYFRKDWEDQRHVNMWSEVISHYWHPTDPFAGALPDIPTTYREHISAYAKEMGSLMTRLLSLLSKGLGLEDGYLKRRLGDQPLFKCNGNYYPPCPNPELTIGLPAHTDSYALGVVRALDHVPGLQIIKDQQWVAVDQPPNSFIVNIGDQLEALSNGRYKSVPHRVVNDESRARVSLAFFWGPGLNDIVEPIEDLVDEQHPPAYRRYLYKDFLLEHEKQLGTRRRVKQLFQLKPAINSDID